MSKTLMAVVAVVCASSCASVVQGHEQALYYSAKEGLSPEIVRGGWYWHLPWNDYLTYDLRWLSHKENIHIHSKDGLHMDIDVVAVVRPVASELYALHTEVGPAFYEELVRPAVFAATRDASSRFNHLEIATQTHNVEAAIRAALEEHLKGKHLELSEVAIQHFDLPKEVEETANKKATSNQILAAREVDVKIAETDARVDQERRRGAMETSSLERKLKAEQELAQAKAQVEIEEARRDAARIHNQTESEEVRAKAEAEAGAIRVKAEAEKTRIAANSQNLSSNYVRLKALETLATALSAGNTKLVVTPTGKDGLPMFFNPFLNPFGNSLQGFSDATPATGGKGKVNDDGP